MGFTVEYDCCFAQLSSQWGWGSPSASTHHVMAPCHGTSPFHDCRLLDGPTPSYIKNYCPGTVLCVLKGVGGGWGVCPVAPTTGL